MNEVISWTDERVALLKKMWGEGKTAAEIAKELGGITRNAVIGKAHRLKLSNRLSPIQQNGKTPAAKVEKEMKPVYRIANDAGRSPFQTQGVQIGELRDKMCRWPMGDPKDADFRFCGLHAVAGLPYCGEHAKVAYQTTSRGRTLNAEDFEERETADDEAREVSVA